MEHMRTCCGNTKGNARASIKYIYDLALALKENGFNPIILHEKKDYTGVASWLDESYMTNLPHRSIEGENLEISPEDFIVLPEIYGFIMEQIKDLPCGKIVLTQSYSYVILTLAISLDCTGSQSYLIFVISCNFLSCYFSLTSKIDLFKILCNC